VVPGGGISPDGNRWIPCRPDFFLPVRALSHLFPRLFLEYLEKAFDQGQLGWDIESAFYLLCQKESWTTMVIETIPPFVRYQHGDSADR
jgi:hypothetical protein